MTGEEGHDEQRGAETAVVVVVAERIYILDIRFPMFVVFTFASSEKPRSLARDTLGHQLACMVDCLNCGLWIRLVAAGSTV